MNTKKMLASSLAMIAASLMIGATAVKAGGDIRLTAQLTSPSGGPAKGVAEFRSRADGSQLKVQVENVNLPGATLNVLINGAQVGTLTIGAALAGEMQLNTKNGDPVPSIQSGSSVAVTDQTGAQIATGFF